MPHVDPDDGGINARLLLLLETPGPRLSSPRFVSRDNSTGTARNITRFMGAAGIDRRDTILWNCVPWIIHADGALNRAPRRDEMEEGLTYLPSFMRLLPKLRVVVMSGRYAGMAESVLLIAKPDLTLFNTPHPSPVFVNTRPDIAPGIVATLKQAALILKQV